MAPTGTTKKPAPAQAPEPQEPPEPTYHNVDETGEEIEAKLQIGNIEHLVKIGVKAPSDKSLTPEGCTAWTNLGFDGLVVNLTSHRATEMDALNGLLSAVISAQIMYGLIPLDRNGNAIPPMRQAPPLKNSGTGNQHGPVKKAGAGPTKNTGTGQPAQEGGLKFEPNVEHKVQISSMEIAPIPAGVGMKFFAPGHKYADVWCSWSPEKALEFLNAGTGYTWTAEDLTKAAKFNVSFVVVFHYSTKLNSQKNQYKDIDRFEPAGEV